MQERKKKRTYQGPSYAHVRQPEGENYLERQFHDALRTMP